MRWTKVSITNFMSIKEATWNLDNRGLILIEGENKTNPAYESNGSGKSTLFASIVYAKYAKTPQGLTADAVVNRQEEKGTAVILEGVRGEDTYRIERYRKHGKHGNKVLLFRNDKDITEKSAKDTNSAIETIVGVDYNTFVNSILFSQSSGAGRFSTATDREKKEILENLVNLSIYGDAQEIAKERVRAKGNEILEEERKGERLSWDLENVSTLEKQDQDNYESTKQVISKEQAALQTAIDELTTYSHHSASEKARLEPLIEEQELIVTQSIGIDISQITTELNASSQDLQVFRNELSTYTRDKDQFVAQYKKLQTDTHCPICGTELDNSHREKEMENLKTKVRGALTQMTATQTAIDAREETYATVLEEYNKQKAVSDESTANYQSRVNTLSSTKGELAQIEVELRERKSRIDNIKKNLDTMRAIPEPKSRESDREEFNKQILTHKKQLTNLHAEKAQIEDVVKVYSNTGVKSHVLDLITPFLNERANKYLSALSGSDITVKFSTQTRNKSGEMTDKFEIQVENNSGGESYESNSGGEKKRVDLAISLAIQDLVQSKSEMSTNYILYDEVFDELDNVGCENIIEILKERLNTTSSIFVITHSNHLKPLFNQVITVTKVDGTTTIEDGAST